MDLLKKLLIIKKLTLLNICQLFFFVGHKSGNSNLIQINKSNNNTELNTPKSTQSMTKTDKTPKNISNESIKKPLEQVNISDLLALHKKK